LAARDSASADGPQFGAGADARALLLYAALNWRRRGRFGRTIRRINRERESSAMATERQREIKRRRKRREKVLKAREREARKHRKRA
jgi:hypothetical protein